MSPFQIAKVFGISLLLMLAIDSHTIDGARKSATKEIDTTSLTLVQAKLILPTYTVLNEDVYDAPVKTQVSQSILVSGEISEPGLRALLEKLYSSIKERRGFKYHKSPTAIYIHAYTTKERYKSGMGLWVAMLQKSPVDVKPKISINKQQIDQLGAKPEVKFGLSEAKRKEIWGELIKAEQRADNEAVKKYPTQLSEQIDLQRTLQDKYEDEIAKKYGLTRKQLDKIGIEGVMKQWPYPKL